MEAGIELHYMIVCMILYYYCVDICLYLLDVYLYFVFDLISRSSKDPRFAVCPDGSIHVS